MGWSQGQAKEFAKRMRKRLGNAWQYMTPEVQGAFIAQEVLLVVLGQDRAAVDVEAIRDLLIAVTKEGT